MSGILAPYLMINAKEKQLLAVGLKMFSGQYSTDYGALFAATAISIIPVLLILSDIPEAVYRRSDIGDSERIGRNKGKGMEKT